MLLLIFLFWLVDIPEQRRAGNQAYIPEFRPCLLGLAWEFITAFLAGFVEGTGVVIKIL